MKLHIETTATEGHDSVATYIMEIEGDFHKVEPADPEDVRMDIGNGRTIVCGSVNGRTHAHDIWQIDGNLRQFKIGGSNTLILERDGQPVSASQLGSDTIPLSFPTGPTGGLQNHEIYLYGPGVTPTGTFLMLVNGELSYVEDAGDLALELDDEGNWYALGGHIAAGTDVHRWAGPVEKVVTGGAEISVELNGQSTTWNGVVSQTGGTGQTPPPRDTGEPEPDPDPRYSGGEAAIAVLLLVFLLRRFL